MRKWSPLIPVVGSYLLSAAVFSRLPATGHPDLSPLVPVSLPQGGGIPRAAAALLIPTIALAQWGVMLLLSRVRGSRRKSLPEWWLNEKTGASGIARFEGTYAALGFAITSLCALFHVALIGSLLEAKPWLYQLLTGILGAGLIAAGNIMPRTRPNWVAGIRTRATLTDPAVWLKTHRALGALMIATGVIVIGLSAVLPRYALVTALTGLLLSLVAAHSIGTHRSGQRGTVNLVL